MRATFSRGLFLYVLSSCNGFIIDKISEQQDAPIPAVPACSIICNAIGTGLQNCASMCENILQPDPSLPQNDCRDAILSLATSDPFKLSAMVFSSGQIIPAIGIISQLLSNSTEAAEFILFLNDFGYPNACVAIETAEYCTITPVLDPSIPPPKFGICLPEDCTESTLPALLNMSSVASLNLNCGFNSYSITTTRALTIALFTILCFLVLLGTILEYYIFAKRSNDEGKIDDGLTSDLTESLLTNKSEAYNERIREVNYGDESDSSRNLSKLEHRKWVKLVLCFGVTENWKHLLHAHSCAHSQLKSFDGLRFFSMLWVILGHVLVFNLMGSGYDNLIDLIPQKGKGILARWSAQAITSAFFSVDTFFFISGFLLAYVMLSKLDKSRSKLVSCMTSRICLLPNLYMHRWIRITPTFIAAVLIYSELLPLFASGPFWDFDADIDVCRDYWWTNIVYISNLVPWRNKPTCFPVGWYLANDFQFFVFFAPLVYVGWAKGLRVTWVSSILVILASTAYTLWLGYGEGIRFTVFDGGLPAFRDGSTGYTYWPDYYLRPWTRVVPYAGGVLAALFWTRNSMLLKNMSTTKNIALTVLWAALLAISVYGTYWAYQDVPSTIPTWLNALYLALSRPTWTAGLAALTFQCFSGRGGIVEKFLELSIFAPLARLSFCAYLIHPTIVLWFYKVQPGSIHFSEIGFAVIFMGASLGTYIASIPLYLIVEAPFKRLEHELIQHH